MEYCRISVITPSLNRRDMLEGVIRNVIAQEYPDFEHIVIDGVSTDGTQDMVKNYPQVHFASEPDEGMYDALNKGLDIATGEIIGFLNTDDFYTERVFSDLAAKFEDERVMAVAGNAVVFREFGNGLAKIVGRYSPEDRTLLECCTLGSNYFNAWFFRKSVFKIIGNFNIGYRVAGDRDFMFRFYLNNLRYVTLDKLVYRYRQHVGSLTFDDTDDKRELSAKDHLTMTSFYLREHKLSSEVRSLLIQLRTREALVMATQSIRAWRFGKYVYYVAESIRYDFTWVLRNGWLAILNVITWPVRFGRRIRKWLYFYRQ